MFSQYMCPFRPDGVARVAVCWGANGVWLCGLGAHRFVSEASQVREGRRGGKRRVTDWGLGPLGRASGTSVFQRQDLRITHLNLAFQVAVKFSVKVGGENVLYLLI